MRFGMQRCSQQPSAHNHAKIVNACYLYHFRHTHHSGDGVVFHPHHVGRHRETPGAHSRRLAIYLGFRRFHDVVLVSGAGAVIAH